MGLRAKLDNWENFDAKLDSLMQNNQLQYDKENLDANYQNLEQYIDKLKQEKEAQVQEALKIQSAKADKSIQEIKAKLDNWENFDAKLNSLMQNNQLQYDKENLDGNYQNLEQYIEKLKQEKQTQEQFQNQKLDQY